MPILAQPYEAYEKPGLVAAYKLAIGKIWKGAAAGVDASGYLAPMSPATAGLRFAGVANESVDNSAGPAGDRTAAIVKSGSFVFKAASGYVPAQADVGKEVYAASDWEVQVATTGLTNAYKLGVIVALESTSTGASGVRVRIDNYSA